MVDAWVGRVIAIQERRPHRFAVAFGLVVSVGVMRWLLEWLLGRRAEAQVNDTMLVVVSFYLVVLFLFTAILALHVRLPWRTCMNVVLVALPVALLPPIVDAIASGIGRFDYEYVTTFPHGWAWSLYRPGHSPLGEASILWLSVACCAFYVHRKRRRVVLTLAAGVMAYAAVVAFGGLIPTLAMRLAPQPLSPGGGVAAVARGQLLATLVLYVALQPQVARGLLARAPHGIPFVLAALIGAAFQGALTASTLWHAALLYFTTVIATALNDHYDRDEDVRQGRRAYLDGEDVAVLMTVHIALIATLIAQQSIVGWLQLLLVVVTLLYSHPLYRGKRYFPANIKAEGIWGGGAFLVGTMAGIDAQTTRIPIPMPPGAVLDAGTLTALVLVFGGWSLVAMLKDYKDVRADTRAGVQTIYTLAVRRGWGLRRVHRRVTTAAALAMLAPLPLLAWHRGWPAVTWLLGVPFAVALVAGASRGPSRAAFHVILAGVGGLLLTVLALLLAWGTLAGCC